MDIMKVKDIRKVYSLKNSENKSEALKGISFSVPKGEFLGIMGPSGAGKSTLLNAISTIDSPTSGVVSIGGRSFVNFDEDELARFRREKLGFIFQDYNLLDTLTLKENIILPLTLAKTDVSVIEDKLEKISETLNIKDILGKYPYEVSGGQKQRASAARAIINDPEIVFADEPTGALDSKSSQDLLDKLLFLNKENDSTIIMVTHDPFAASYCDRILFIKDGIIHSEIEKQGKRKELYNEILHHQSIVTGGSDDGAIQIRVN